MQALLFGGGDVKADFVDGSDRSLAHLVVVCLYKEIRVE